MHEPPDELDEEPPDEEPPDEEPPDEEPPDEEPPDEDVDDPPDDPGVTSCSSVKPLLPLLAQAAAPHTMAIESAEKTTARPGSPRMVHLTRAK